MGGRQSFGRRRFWATGRADLPMEPLGVLLGHGRIDEAEYRAGQRLEQARRVCFGVDVAPTRAVYEGTTGSGGPDQWAAQQAAALGEDETLEMRRSGEYGRLLRALRRCGDEVSRATLGIATRPYAGAWLAAALVESGRRWTARHDTRLALIREGLAAIAALGDREL